MKDKKILETAKKEKTASETKKLIKNRKNFLKKFSQRFKALDLTGATEKPESK